MEFSNLTNLAHLREYMRKNSLTLTILCFLFLSLFPTKGAAQYDLGQFFLKGRQLLIDGRYSSAIENFNTLVRLDTTLYDAYFFRGIAKYNLGDFLGAERDFDKALELNPIYTPAYHYRAITLSRTGKYEAALKDLAEAVDLRPSYTGLYFSRGVTYFLSQQFDKAVSDFNKFIRQESNEPDAYLNRGACYLFLGDTLKALDDYNKAISINVFDPEGYIRRSRIWALQEKDSLALTDLNKAISLDSVNTFAYFNRAFVRYNLKDINGALEDLNKVLEEEPGNALTLYNRALIRSQIGDFNNALDDYDRVIRVNPQNVLAYFNRAGVYLQMRRFKDAMDDYSQAINLYPDFAKAYMNRAYAKSQMGQYNSARRDEEIAREKVKEYRTKTADSLSAQMFADTAKRFDQMIALDSDFAKRDFSNNELLQYRDVDIRLKPLFKFNLAEEKQRKVALDNRFESKTLETFLDKLPLYAGLSSIKHNDADISTVTADSLMSLIPKSSKDAEIQALIHFSRALVEDSQNRYNEALEDYDKALSLDKDNAFLYINRGVLQAEMIDFISSMERNVQTLTLDNSRTARARVNDSYAHYDYTAAIHDMKRSLELMPKFPFTYYNLGNLYCLSSDLPEAILQYTKAIQLYPNLKEAYYNRGLVLIYLKDSEKGCLDMSKAGELGVPEAYSVISKYCLKKNQ